jgi:hypothetical protein
MLGMNASGNIKRTRPVPPLLSPFNTIVEHANKLEPHELRWA